MKLWIVAFAVFIINLPFGFWRKNVEKFSLQWFLAIHLPVPFIIALRIMAGIGFKFITYPILLGSDLLGQIIGGKIYLNYIRHYKQYATSCLFSAIHRIL